VAIDNSGVKSIRAGALSLVALLVLTSEASGQLEPFRDRRLALEDRARDLLGRMTLEEKFWQLYMTPGDIDEASNDWSHGVFGLQVRVPDSTSPRSHAERVNAIQRFFVERIRLGIPLIPFEEGVHGLLAPGATMFPAAIGLAATWDTSLMTRVASAIARETRSRGIRQVLSPVVNITRDPRWGRTEETYGEDHFLAGLMGGAYVNAFERAGVITTPKHFVANVGEGGRDSWPIDLSERLLREVYFPPFQAALRVGARSLMTAYNSVDGVPATQSRWLLSDILRGHWQFPGFVISDMSATGGATVLHMTESNTPAAAAHAWSSGLDVVFQSTWAQHRPYLEAMRSGLVPPAIIDSAVTRVLRAKFALGLFEHPYANVDSAARWNGAEEHRAIALEAAQNSLVLLRNEGQTLPLSNAIRSLAVIGSDAVEARLGGYSGPGVKPVSILEALRARLGDRVRYAAGPGRYVTDGEPVDSSAWEGLRGEYFDNVDLAGTPRLIRDESRLDFASAFGAPGEGIARDWYSVRWIGRLTVPGPRSRRLGVEGNDGYRLWIDGRLALDNPRPRSFGLRFSNVVLERGRTYDVRVEYREPAGNGRIRLVWDAADAHQVYIEEARNLARASEATVIVTGIEEGEFRDRASLALPGRQGELIAQVATLGKPLVVVIVGGSAVTMPWLERVGAVLLAWYPGEAGGEAIADALLGKTNPGGRLPITFPMSEGQLPLYYNHKPTGRGDDYADLTGRPLFPFGFGLSYSTFAYSDLVIRGDGSPAFTVQARVTNSGAMRGDEVVQLYLRDELASVARPVMQLAGFRRVSLDPGQSAVVEFTITRDQLALLDEKLDSVVEPGAWRVMVGSSSRDIRLKGEYTVR
jgi:beta-glucosidase